MKSSIYDIAKKAGVSTATVSRVLNRSDNISENTREKILEIIERDNYSPRVAKIKAKRIGIIVPPYQHLFSSYYVSEVLSAISDYFFHLNYELVFLTADFEKADATKLVYLLRTENISFAFFLYGVVDHKAILGIAKKKFPHLFVGGSLSNKNVINYLDCDNYSGARKAVMHLMSLGHRKISMIAFPKHFRASGEKLRGYTDTLSDSRIKFNEDNVVYASGTKATDGYNSTMELLTRNVPSAIFASNDNLAIGAYKALSKSGYKIPEDISIVGFDDVPLAEYLNPPLTTVRVPFYEMGRRACELVQDYFSSGKVKLIQEKIEGTLLVRNSTVKAKNSKKEVR